MSRYLSGQTNHTLIVDPNNSYSPYGSGNPIPVSNSTKQLNEILIANSNNLETINFRVVGANSSGNRYFSNDVNITDYACPSVDVKCRISSANGSDTQTIRVHGVNKSGDAVSADLVLNGTSNVDSSASFVHVNYLTNTSSTEPLGIITVKLDTANDNGFATTLGSYILNFYGGNWCLVPNGKKLLVKNITATNYYNTAVTLRYDLITVKNWLNNTSTYPAYAVSSVQFMDSNNTYLNLTHDYLYVFEAGTMIKIHVSSGSATIPIVEGCYHLIDA